MPSLLDQHKFDVEAKKKILFWITHIFNIVLLQRKQNGCLPMNEFFCGSGPRPPNLAPLLTHSSASIAVADLLVRFATVQHISPLCGNGDHGYLRHAPWARGPQPWGSGGREESMTYCYVFCIKNELRKSIQWVCVRVAVLRFRKSLTTRALLQLS